MPYYQPEECKIQLRFDTATVLVQRDRGMFDVLLIYGDGNGSEEWAEKRVDVTDSNTPDDVCSLSDMTVLAKDARGSAWFPHRSLIYGADIVGPGRKVGIAKGKTAVTSVKIRIRPLNDEERAALIVAYMATDSLDVLFFGEML